MDRFPQIVCTIQARTGSSRLPNKMLRELGGKSLLSHVIENAKGARHIGEIIVATSDCEKDDPIERIAKAHNVSCFRGSESDVLSRVCQAIAALDSNSSLVHCFGDNPYTDSEVLDFVIDQWMDSDCQYGLLRDFPVGVTCDLYKTSFLREVDAEAKSPPNREHINSYVLDRIKKIDHIVIHPPKWLEGLAARLTIDDGRDWELAEAIQKELDQAGITASCRNVARLLKQHPELAGINNTTTQRYVSSKAASLRGHSNSSNG